MGDKRLKGTYNVNVIDNHLPEVMEIEEDFKSLEKVGSADQKEDAPLIKNPTSSIKGKLVYVLSKYFTIYSCHVVFGPPPLGEGVL